MRDWKRYEIKPLEDRIKEAMTWLALQTIILAGELKTQLAFNSERTASTWRDFMNSFQTLYSATCVFIPEKKRKEIDKFLRMFVYYNDVIKKKNEINWLVANEKLEPEKAANLNLEKITNT